MSNEKATSSKNKELIINPDKPESVSRSTPALSDSAAMMQMIGQAATDPAVDMDKMERLWGMKKEMDANDAEKAFNVAMSKAQSKMTTIVAESENEQTKSKYAKHETIAKAIKPVYTKEGFSITFSEGDSHKEKYIRVMAILRHKQGHSEKHHLDLPLDLTGIKGSVNKTDIHGTGSTYTYGRRYLTCMIFDVATGDDDDGNAASAPPPLTITDEQATYLHALMTDNDLNTDHIMAWLESDIGCKTFGELYVNNFAVVERTIKAAITAKGAPS